MGNPIRTMALVTELVPHGPGVYRVRLSPQCGVPRFKPGQFLHLALDEFDPTTGYWPESRVFSIASGLSDDYLEIIYSVKGRYTARMERELAVGRSVWLKLPYGSFLINRPEANGGVVILVAGGTGVSPFIPYIRDVIRRPAESQVRKIVLHLGIRSAGLLLYGDVLRSAAQSLSHFTWRVWIEEGEGIAIDREDSVIQLRGRLDPETVVRDDEQADGVYFLSGPPAMIGLFRVT